MPERMSNSWAKKLLKICTRDVEIRVASPELQYGELYHPAVAIYPSWRGPCEEAAARAMRLRAQLEALRLLACFHGLDPEENPAFWRKGLRSPYREVTHRIPSDIFRCLNVVCDADTDPESTAVALWMLMPSCSHPDVVESRQLLEESFENCLERTPPPLEIKLCVRPGYDSWVTIKQALLHLNRLLGSSGDKLRLAVGCQNESEFEDGRIEYGGRSDVLVDILAIPCVILEELHLKPVHPDASTLSLLMRELVRVDTVRALSWEFECEPHAVAAIFSAIPSLTTLTSLARYCSHDSVEVGVCKRRTCRFWAWFAYAMTQRKLQGLPLALSFQVDSVAKSTVEAACQRQNCLEGIMSTILADEEVSVFHAHGTSAELVNASIVLSLETRVSPRSVIVSPAQRVIVVAQYDSLAIVVIPGVGLMSAESTSLRACQQGTLVEPDHPMVKTVQELQISYLGLTADQIRSLSRRVRERKQLTFLRLAVQQDAIDDKTVENELMSLMDQPLHQNEPSKSSMSTFLLLARGKYLMRELAAPCPKTIAQFAATRVLRWVLGEVV